MNAIASIDIGSNTLRLLILASDAKGGIREIESERVITRLGEGMDVHGRLSDKRMAAALETLSRFRETCARFGNVPIHAVATSAVREAENKQEFLRRVKDETGIDIEVVSWEKEARLTLEGVFWKIPDCGQRTLVFDIGGGSTEFILSEGKKPAGFHGTSLGVVRLTEQYITRHPIAAEEFSRLRSHIRRELENVKASLKEFDPEIVIGTAGTVTTLAAIDGDIYPYDPEKIHGILLPLSRIQALLEMLKGKSLKQRLAIKSLERGREDLIIAGTTIVLETLRAFGGDTLTVSEHSLREGIILNALANEPILKAAR